MHIKVRYPDVILNIKDVKAAIDVSDKQGDELEKCLEELDSNISIKDSKESGICRRERILNIIPIDEPSIDDRRINVLSRWYDSPVYTETVLRNKLDSMIGKENYHLKIDLDEKTVRYETKSINNAALNTVYSMLDEIVPLDYTIEIKLMYSHSSIFYVANMVKEAKTIKPLEFVAKNPLDDIFWYVNEKNDVLTDEYGNVLEV